MHIADYPCHGKMYHDIDDSYPNGDRDGITHEQMMAKIKDQEVDYWFGYSLPWLQCNQPKSDSLEEV